MTLVENRLIIEAPVARVWATLMDRAAYRDWNPRLLEIEGELKAGAIVTLTYAKSSRWFPNVFVVDVDVSKHERELRWSGPRNASKRAIRASHYFLLQNAGSHTNFTHGELFEGFLAKAVWPVLGKEVRANHDEVNDALKRRCESS